MHDHEVRELLGRYRPVGPPPDLRGRVFRSSVRSSRNWPWAVAAAALLAATLGLHSATNHVLATVAQPSAPLTVDALAAAMGGTDEARQAAELIVKEQKFREWLSERDVRTRTIEDELNRVN
jgi:hypothetical protein